MAERQSLGDRVRRYQPTKTVLFWCCAASIALTMIVGFSWGGWVTAKTVQEMVEDASEDGRAQLAATVCVEQFLKGADAATQLASLKQTDSWKKKSFVADGGWATLPGMKEPVMDAAEVCAERLLEMDVPAKKAASQ